MIVAGEVKDAVNEQAIDFFHELKPVVDSLTRRRLQRDHDVADRARNVTEFALAQ